MEYKRLEKRADRLLETISGWWQELPIGYLLSEESYGRLIHRLVNELKLPDFSCVHGSYTNFICGQTSKKTLFDLCYNMIANIERFKRHITVPFSSVGYDGSIEEFRIVGMPAIVENRLQTHIRTLTGVKAGREEMYVIYWNKVVDWFHACGCYGRLYTPSVKAPHAALCNAYILLRVQPKGTSSRSLSECEVTPVDDDNVTRKNRQELYKYRFGVVDCEHEMSGHETLDNYCIKFCPLGCRTCTASSHEYDYRKGTCPKCGKTNVYMPDNSFYCCSCSMKWRKDD